MTAGPASSPEAAGRAWLDDQYRYGIDTATAEVLAAHGLDAATFAALRAGVADGSRSAEANIVTGTVTAPPADAVTVLPRRGDSAHASAVEAGTAALRAGQAACVVLCGGMATRFGGVVKAAVEAVEGMTFAEIKLVLAAQAARAAGGEVPVALMTSWATDGPIRRLLAEVAARGGDSLGPPAAYFTQYVAPRLRQDGGIFRTADGGVSLYSCGHGDFLAAFRASGTLRALRSRGVRYVMVSNLDNLAARPDPLVLGTHIAAGRAATAEVVGGLAEVAGAPVLADGRLRIIERVQFPPGLDQSALLASTNTITFSIGALDREFDPAWLYVRKTVEGRQAVQLERAYAAGCDVLPTTILRVPASGQHSRFLPVKTPADLAAATPRLRELLATSATFR